MSGLVVLRRGIGLARDIFALGGLLMALFLLRHAVVPAECLAPGNGFFCGVMYAENLIFTSLSWSFIAVAVWRASVGAIQHYLAFVDSD